MGRSPRGWKELRPAAFQLLPGCSPATPGRLVCGNVRFHSSSHTTRPRKLRCARASGEQMVWVESGAQTRERCLPPVLATAYHTLPLRLLGTGPEPEGV